MDKPLAVLFGCCSKSNPKPFPEVEISVSATIIQSENIWEQIDSTSSSFFFLICISIQTTYLDVSCFFMDVLLALDSEISGARILEQQLLGDLYFWCHLFKTLFHKKQEGLPMGQLNWYTIWRQNYPIILSYRQKAFVEELNLWYCLHRVVIEWNEC